MYVYKGIENNAMTLTCKIILLPLVFSLLFYELIMRRLLFLLLLSLLTNPTLPNCHLSVIIYALIDCVGT